MKKRLTQSEEFEIMKLVLDKFLWLGVAILGYGFFALINGNTQFGFFTMLGGIIILVSFSVLIVKEYEIIK